ncbi:hypothetical protein [Nocardia asiatica]|uniref:hypothetical protein n=1 Tax=Nocardia asiatica TaxID=209252 RepID=UPI003EE292A2
MTRDLPFDEDTEGAERAGDTAYRVATGVARVARAGAYVTGGALVAANGGGVPAQPGESRLDSRQTGWAHSTDPDPDQPSPVITFPDQIVEPAPISSHGSNVPVAHGNPAPGALPTPGFTLPGAGVGPAGSLPAFGDEYSGTDAGFPLPTLPNGDAGHGMQLPGYSGGGVPGLGGIPGTDGDSANGLTIPGTEGNVSGGLPLPGARPESANEFDAPGGHGFGLPGHGLGQAGHGFGLPGANGFVPPGSTVFDLPGNSALNAAQAAGNPFDGVGQDAGHGGDLGLFVGTQWSVDFGIGPNGIYFTSEMQVDVAAGHVGDQLDQYTDWLADGIHVPDGTDHAVTEPHAPGHGHPGLLGGLTAPGTSGTQASGVAQSPSAGVAQPQAVSSVAQPLAASAPVAPAPTAAAAPVAPVAPAAPAPAAAPAAVAAAPVVAATPLQTTIQPDAASTPIANVLAAPEGPSVLTAPAAAVPALFDAVRPTLAVQPTPATDPQQTHPTQPSTPSAPTTIVKTTPTPSVPGDVTTPSAPKTPDQDVTKIPGATTLPHGGITTAPDVVTTKTPGATITQPPTPTHGSTTPDDDVTTPGGVTGRPSTGGTSHSNYPTDDVPTHNLPTDDVPTVSRPSQPTYTAPDQPTYSAPAHAPTIEPHTPVTPAPVVPAPTQAPFKPQVIDPKPQGISAPMAADTSMVAEHGYDHSALTSASYSGLSGGLLPDSATAGMHQASDMSDISLM